MLKVPQFFTSSFFPTRVMDMVPSDLLRVRRSARGHLSADRSASTAADSPGHRALVARGHPQGFPQDPKINLGRKNMFHHVSIFYGMHGDVGEKTLKMCSQLDVLLDDLTRIFPHDQFPLN